jgi:hypothetical protein
MVGVAGDAPNEGLHKARHVACAMGVFFELGIQPSRSVERVVQIDCIIEQVIA